MRVFITGAGSGLGAALARHYGNAGAALGLLGRRLAPLQDNARGLDARLYAADVGDAEALALAAQDFIAHAGCPDIVIASAGISVGALAQERGDLEVFRASFANNVMGVLHTFQPFIAPMQAAGRGSLCGIASVAGVRGLPGGGAYSASKAALIAWLESLRLELAASGISVVTVSPGYIDTPMTRVNPYAMPFRMSAERAAAKVAQAIARRRRHAVIPWKMALVARALRCLPDAWYDRMFARAPRKPRGLPL